MLDKDLCRVIEYTGIQYRDERKEYRINNRREFGSPAESPNGIGSGKVRPGAKHTLKVINESGTAAQTASCTNDGIRGIFYCNNSMEVKFYVFV